MDGWMEREGEWKARTKEGRKDDRREEVRDGGRVGKVGGLGGRNDG